MSDHLSYQANPETRGTVAIQFFEADGGTPPPGTQATPRPPDQPRELPPIGLSSASLQLFECEKSAGAEDAATTPRPGGEERARR
jgi:hypothetical protein